MMTDRTDVSLPFILKMERDICDVGPDDFDHIHTMLLPSFSMNNSAVSDESNNEFLRLTTTVRAVYLSYLHKCLRSNYINCWKQKNESIPYVEVKKFADQMELNAVGLSLETSLYRQNMLKLIADVKSHTVNKKPYKKLIIFLETPADRYNVAVQTDDITSDHREMLQTESVIVKPTSFSKYNNATKDDLHDEIDIRMLGNKNTTKRQSDNSVTNREATNQKDFHITNNAIAVMEENENSQDSLFQHMEDMFCDSDDSTDLTRLIEKHSGISKANATKDITKVYSEPAMDCLEITQNNDVSKSTTREILNSTGDNVSLSHPKDIQNRKMNNATGISGHGTIESKQKQKVNAIWFVERVHQVSKLKAKMIELSLRNYQKHGKLKEEFHHLFGESEEEEEMMPDSPICIEEYLPACKERIAPWIVKYLMPFYKKGRIKNRQLFKAIAKYIADMLIVENTFPEQKYVSKYIENYFKKKKLIKTKQDIYL